MRAEGTSARGIAASFHLVLLVCAWQESRDVNKRDDGDVEGVAEADEPARHSGSSSSSSAQHGGAGF